MNRMRNARALLLYQQKLRDDEESLFQLERLFGIKAATRGKTASHVTAPLLNVAFHRSCLGDRAVLIMRAVQPKCLYRNLPDAVRAVSGR